MTDLPGASGRGVARSELAFGYRALKEGRGAAVLPWEALVASGPDAASYLQGQLSQDVEGLAVGESALSLVLEPQGRLDALVRVTRTGPEAFLLDLEAGFADALLARLERFRLRTKVTFAVLRDLALVATFPKDARDGGDPVSADPAIGADPGTPGTVGLGGEGRVRLPRLWPALSGLDLLGPAESPGLPKGLVAVPKEAYEAVRIEAGLPAMGKELTERTIPAEAGVVEVAVSFTKGCYTGQELVARIEARGSHVPRRLRAVVLGDGPEPPVGAELVSGDKVVGSLTSVAWSPVFGVVGLGYVARGVEPPAAVLVRSHAATLEAEVRELPLR